LEFLFRAAHTLMMVGLALLAISWVVDLQGQVCRAVLHFGVSPDTSE
jgi:hypothetical protein